MKITNPIKYAVGIGLVGILISSLVIYVERRMVVTNNRNQPYIVLGEYLKNISTKAHLWFEEAMSGDESIDINKEVYGYLDLSVKTLESAISGRETDVGKFYKTTDEETLAILNESIEDVKNLRASAEKRWKFRAETLKNKTDSALSTAGEEAGGVLDQEFDAAYEELQLTYDRLVKHVIENVASDNAFLNNMSWMSVSIIIVVFSILCFVLYRVQQKNELLTDSRMVKLKEETERIESLNKFVQTISGGDFTSAFEVKDELSAQLANMRNTLRENSEKEQKRIWASTGLAQIGDILRSNYKEVKELYDRIIQFVVKYSASNQGFLFLLNDEDERDQFLELVAAYAFDRKKFLEKKIAPGEGLTGQCYLEGAPIHMINIPQNYTQITSGLGGATPSSLLIMPLIINKKIYGIMEIASFNKYEPNEIELIEKFAESIASTISTVRVNERTRLLLERTQQQAEEMRAQEEEMRQNMEELSATQEEMSRKEKEYLGRIKELEELTREELNVGGMHPKMEYTKQPIPQV